MSQVRRRDKVVTVTVTEERPIRPARGSYQIRSLLAHFGEQMGFIIWVPRRDRQAILRDWQPKEGALFQNLRTDRNGQDFWRKP